MKRSALSIACLVCLSPSAAAWASSPSAAAPVSPAEVARYASDMMMRRYRADAPGGAVLVARGNAVLFRAARGEADTGKHVPLRPDSVFRIGSVTKQFAAAGLLTLVEAGKVELDDPLSKYVPDYPGGAGITVQQLLAHTSGVKDYTGLKGYMAGPVQRDLTTAQLVDVFKNETPDFAAGSSWKYSNSGYVLVGAVIEAASGQPWHAYLERALFKPLGMKHTGYAHDPKRVAGQVRGYSYAGGKLVPARPISMTQPHAGGSLLSNVDDLFRWTRALHEGRVLKSAAYTRMITPEGKAAEVGYGFGLFNETVRRNKVLSHGGRIFGFMSSLDYLPGPGITVVVLENDDQDNDHVGGDSADTVARKLAAMALGDPYPEMRAIAVDAAALTAIEGVYRFDGDVKRILRVVDGTLTSQRGTRGEPQPLTPIATDDFLYPDGFNRLKLARDSSGKVTSARFFPRGDGEGAAGALTRDPLPTARLARAALERVVGTFAHREAGLTLKVYFEGDALLGQIAGQEAVTLRAKSPTLFDVEETGATVDFPAGGERAGQVTMRQNGREITLKREP